MTQNLKCTEKKHKTQNAKGQRLYRCSSYHFFSWFLSQHKRTFKKEWTRWIWIWMLAMNFEILKGNWASKLCQNYNESTISKCINFRYVDFLDFSNKSQICLYKSENFKWYYKEHEEDLFFYFLLSIKNQLFLNTSTRNVRTHKLSYISEKFSYEFILVINQPFHT